MLHFFVLRCANVHLRSRFIIVHTVYLLQHRFGGVLRTLLTYAGLVPWLQLQPTAGASIAT